MLEAEFPRPIDSSVRFFDRYSVWDVIVRFGVPVGLGWYVEGAPGAVIGLVLGLVLIEWKPGGKPLDKHLEDTLSALTRSGRVHALKVRKVLDDTAVLKDGTVVGIVEVSASPLNSLSETERRADWGTVHDMVNGVEGRVELHSRQRQVDVSDRPGPADSLVATDHYAVVRVDDEKSVTARKQRLDARCSRITDALNRSDLSADRLTGNKFRKAFNRLYLGEVNLSSHEYRVEYDPRPVHRMKSVTEFPCRMKLGWISDLLELEVSGSINVVQTIRPITNYQRDRLDHKINQLEVEATNSQSPVRQTNLRQQLEDIEDLVDIQGRGEALVNYGVHIVARGVSPEEADATLAKVESHLRGRRVELEAPQRMRKAAKIESGFHRERLQESMVVPGRAAASGYSFSASAINDAEGIQFGRNTRDASPVVADRFSWEAGHMVVLGKTGSGKSFWTGLMLLRAAQISDLEIHILDGKRRDYRGVSEALDGRTVVLDHVDLDAIESEKVTRYTVRDSTKDNTGLLVEAVRHIYRRAARTDSKTLVVIDEVHRILTDGNQVCEEGVGVVSKLVRESRDRNIAVTLISQNADEFGRSNEGRNILRNVDAAALFKQQDVNTEVENFFKLSEDESVQLQKLATGTKLGYSQALLRGQINALLKIEATPREHQILDGIYPDDNSVETEASPSAETDGGHAGDTKQSREESKGEESDKTSEPPGLLACINYVTRASPKRFEIGLAGVFVGGVILALTGVVGTGQVNALLAAVGFPIGNALLGFAVGLVAILYLFELGWMLVLGTGVWLTEASKA